MEQQKEAGFDTRSFCWDWRRQFEETEPKLAKFLAGLNLGTGPGKRQVVLVTHSTGSLLAWPTISRHPEYFAAWVSVGGALGGGTTTLRDLCQGWTQSGVRFLTPETNFR